MLQTGVKCVKGLSCSALIHNNASTLANPQFVVSFKLYLFSSLSYLILPLSFVVEFVSAQFFNGANRFLSNARNFFDGKSV